MTNLLKNKRIILLFGSLHLGGAERQGLLLAEALKDDYGADVQVWGLPNEPGRFSELCDEKGIPWRAADFNWGQTGVTRFISLARLALALRKERPDIILSYTAVPNLACGITWRKTGAKLFVWNQRDEGLLLNKKFWHRLAVRKTQRFLCNSTAGKAFLENYYGVKSERISVIHNGVVSGKPASSRGEWRQRLSLAEGTPVACMLANIHREKDHDTLLRAWAIVHGGWENGPKPVLLLAGRSDEGEDRLRNLAKSSGIGESVRFLGRVDDVPGLLSAVDLCVHSSRSEGLPNAVLEAMAAGVPIVGTDIPGIREAVGPDGYPFLAAVGNPGELAEKILGVFSFPCVSLRVGAQLKQRVRDAFSPENMVHATARYLIGPSNL